MSAGERAPLEVDRESLLELSRGANLYSSKLAFVRELVQNAVDATLLRVFAEGGASAFETHEGSLSELRARLAAHPIDVTVERVHGEVDDPERTYRLVIEDRGIGIVRGDIPFLQRIGSSAKNPRRSALIEAMPEWTRSWCPPPEPRRARPRSSAAGRAQPVDEGATADGAREAVAP